MKQVLLLILALGILGSGTAGARDTIVMIPLQEVIDMPEAKGRLDGSVRFFLSGQATPAIQERLGDDVSNRKTNGANKGDREGCKWAALSALLAFQASAQQVGANAVVDIVSYYKKQVVSDPARFECHAGAIIIGVALKGTYARVSP